MSNRRHNGKLTTLREDTCAETDKDLGQSQNTDGRIGLSEGNQKRGSEEQDRDAGHGNPLEVTSIGNQNANGSGKDRGSE